MLLPTSYFYSQPQYCMQYLNRRLFIFMIDTWNRDSFNQIEITFLKILLHNNCICAYYTAIMFYSLILKIVYL